MYLFEIRINDPEGEWNPIRIVQPTDEVMAAGQNGIDAYHGYWGKRSSPLPPLEISTIRRMSVKLVGPVEVMK